ncbi:MAG: hypothetical protein COA47_01885 [Robiginitomaculum sp.]|nr:MAG: hypothetical protein COA47_01885 [Robiginitomaculum sp.]
MWQRLADETHPDPILHSALLLRGSALAIVLILGGIVGATTSTAQASTSLHAFSSAPAYSIMKLVQN